MNFVEKEQERYVELLSSDLGKKLFPNGSKVAGSFHGRAVPYRLDARYSEENIEPSIRDAAIKYLAENSTTQKYPVSDNLCNSNIAYINFWFGFNSAPDKLKKLLVSLGYDVVELLDLSNDKPNFSNRKPAYIGFEYGGMNDYLRKESLEVDGKPQPHSTIADFYFRFRRSDGKIQAVIGEWKYTENHHFSARELKPKLKRKIEKFTRFFINLNLPKNIDEYELAFDPFRQIARLQLLAHEMETAKEYGTDVVSLLLVTPKANISFNFDIIPKGLGSLGNSVFEIWEKIANKDRFKGVYLEELFNLVVKNNCPPSTNWMNYQIERYNLAELAASTIKTVSIQHEQKTGTTPPAHPSRYAVVNNEFEIEQLQMALRDKFLDNSDEKDLVGKLPIDQWSVCQLDVSGSEDVWYLYNLHVNMQGSRKDRYWNIFGSGEYTHWRHAELELNIPMSSDRSMQAAFAQDDQGAIYLVHRGGFRGKKRMMKRKFFMERFNGKIIAVGEGKKLQNFAVIACLDDPGEKFVSDVVTFFSEVKRIKEEFNSNT